MTTLRHNTQHTEQQKFNIGNGEIWSLHKLTLYQLVESLICALLTILDAEGLGF